MSYWKTVVSATFICLAVGILWQAALLLRALRIIQSQRATGYVVFGRGPGWFLISALVAGWISGSLWYFLREKR